MIRLWISVLFIAMRNQVMLIYRFFSGSKRLLCFLLSLFVVLFIPVYAHASHNTPSERQGIVVIVSPESTLDDLTVTGLRSIFSMRKRIDSEGNLLKVFVLADDDPVHVLFAKEVLHTFPFNLRRIWDRKIYSGTGQSPTVVSSEKEMREKVSVNENAIGYIRRDMINRDVKVVETQ